MYVKQILKDHGKKIVVGANACWPPGTSLICVDTKVDTMEGLLEMIVTLIEGAIALSGLVAVALLVYAGYNYMLGMGDPDKIVTSNKMVTNAIIGLIIISITGLIIRFVLEYVIKSGG